MISLGLDASWLEHFTDQVLEDWIESGTINNIEYLSLDTCDSLSELALTELVAAHGDHLKALNLGGHRHVFR